MELVQVEKAFGNGQSTIGNNGQKNSLEKKLVCRENHPKHCSVDFSLFSYDESIYLRDVTSYKSSAI